MGYLPLEDLILTGNPRAVTAIPGDSDTSIATTEFVGNELSNYLPLAGGTITGEVTFDTGSSLVLDEGATFEFGAVSLSQYDPNTLKTDQDFAAGGNIVTMQGLPEEVVIGNAGPLGTAAGLTFGTDTNLYRFDSGVLKTDGELIVAGDLAVESDLSVDGKLSVSGGLSLKTVAVSGAVSVDLATSYIYLVDTLSSPATITLPATHSIGDMVVVKDHKGSSVTNNITIETFDSDTIDGAATFTIVVAYQAVTFVSDGTNWAII